MVMMILIILGVLTVVFTQTVWFRRIVVNELVREIERTTNGTLTIERLDGNLFSGFILRDARLTLKTRTAYDTVDLLYADQILVQYNIFKLLDAEELGARSIIIRRPTIRFVRYEGDTLWNYEMLLKPVAPNQPPPQPFTQIVRLENVRIINGTFRVRDFNKPATLLTETSPVAEREIDWGDLQIEEIDLDGHLFARGSSALSAKIDHLRFTDRTSGFFVHHLSFSAYLDSLQTRMDNAKIVTGHSNVGFSLEVAPPTLLQTGLLESLKNSGTSLRLIGPSISTYELKQFLPELGFLGGTPGIDLLAEGEFSKLQIRKLNLDFKGQGKINIAGELANLHRPQDLNMNLRLSANGLSNATVRTYVPGLGIPDLGGLGVVNIPSLSYKGTPLKFATGFDVRTTAAGGARGTADLDLRGAWMAYKVDITSSALNFGAIVNDAALRTNLSAVVKLNGRGLDYRTLTSTFDVRTTAPSTIGSYSFSHFSGTGLVDRGRAIVDAMSFNMVNGPSADIDQAAIDFARSNPTYYFDGEVRDFRVAQFIPSFPNKQLMLTFDANVTGIGDDLTSISGTIDARIHNLYLAGERLRDITASIELQPRDGFNSIDLKSEIADILIEGQYRLSDIMRELPQRFEAIATAISEQHFPEPGDSGSPVLHAATQCRDSVDLNFRIVSKDLRPLSAIFPRLTLQARGAIEGEVIGCSSRDLNVFAESDSLTLLFRNRRGQMDTLFAMDISDTLQVDTVTGTVVRRVPPDSASLPRIQTTPTKLSVRIENMVKDPTTVLDSLDFSLHFSDSLARYNNLLFQQPTIDIAYRNQQLVYDVSSWINNAVKIDAVGDATFPAGDLVMQMDTFAFQLKDRRPKGAARGNRQQDIEYRWLNRTPVKITLSGDGVFEIDTFRMAKLATNRPGMFSDEVTLAARLDGDSIDYAFLELPELSVRDLTEILPPSNKTYQLDQVQGKLSTFRASMSNTLAKPEIDVEASLSKIIFKQLRFDTSYLNLHYRNQALRGDVYLKIDTSIISTTDLSTLVIPWNNVLVAHIDSIPMLISFARYPGYSADSAAVLKRPLSAGLTARNFPIDVVAPFLPMFTSLSGIGNVVLSVTGTQENIDYRGSADIDDGGFLLAGNNVYYTFEGGLEFNRERLDLRDIVVRNTPADDPNGAAIVSGGIDLKGFSVRNFDLNLYTNRLTVLTNASAASLKTVYGPLAIATVDTPLVFSGSTLAPMLGGSIQVQYARLNFQNQQSRQRASSEGIRYQYIVGDSVYTDSSLTVENQRLRDVLRDTTKWTERDELLWPTLDADIMAEELTLADSMVAAIQQESYRNGKQKEGPSSGFADRMQYDLHISIPGDAYIITHFASTLGILGERLQAELQTVGAPVHIHRGPDRQLQIIGTIGLTDNSEYRLYKTFVITKGVIEFTGDPTNPAIDITAEHRGTNNATEQEVVIQVNIRNTLQEPQLSINIYTDEGGSLAERTGTEQEIQEDAIFFLLTSRFKDDLGVPEQLGAIQKAATQLGSQVANQLLGSLAGSAIFRDVLRSASVELGQSPKLKLTAAFKSVTVRLSAGPNADADVSVEVPLSALVDFKNAENFRFNFEHLSSESRERAPIDQAEYLAKFLVRIPLP